MDIKIKEYIEESIKMEYNASDMYLLFAHTYDEDHAFWIKLANEEMNHASLLKTMLELLETNDLPKDFLIGDIEELKTNNKTFSDNMVLFKETPTREMCFDIAFKIESTVSEVQFHMSMGSISDDPIMKILQKLNADDVEHYKRIYMYYKTIL